MIFNDLDVRVVPFENQRTVNGSPAQFCVKPAIVNRMLFTAAIRKCYLPEFHVASKYALMALRACLMPSFLQVM
jgi:hypothetical protein